jgi:enoyl-[acyl-carrier-protein] reductase (NADH)
MSNSLMAGKRGLIMGLANDKSIAWGIARACADAGAEMAFSYMGEAFRKRVQPLAEQMRPRSMRHLPRSNRNGASWIFWCMPLVFPTKTNCAGAMWIPAATIS